MSRRLALDAMLAVALVLTLGSFAPAALAGQGDEQHGSGHAAATSTPTATPTATAGHGEAAAAEHAEESHGRPWAAILINFAVFVSILAFFLGRPAKAFFKERAGSIVTALTAAERARAEAQAKLAEVEQRLTDVEEQGQAILDGAARHAEAERDRILAAASEDAKRILSQAEARVGELESAARRRLRIVAADLAVEAARELVAKNITPEDRSRAFERNLKALQSQDG